MSRANVGPGSPLPVVTSTPEQLDAGIQVAAQEACDNDKTVSQNDSELSITEQVTAAETEKLDGILETIRGPTTMSAEPETPEEGMLKVKIGDICITISGEQSKFIQQEILKKHKATLDLKDVAVQTDDVVISKETCPEYQASANAEAETSN